MYEYDNLENLMPVGPLKIAALEGCREFGETVNRYLIQTRKETAQANAALARMPGYIEDSYLLDCKCPRFGSGEGKGQINASVRGADLYILVDVCNYSLTYSGLRLMRIICHRTTIFRI